MFEQLKIMLTNWNITTSDRQKLQHTYVLLIGFVIFLAGIVALFSGERSRQLMFVALALVTAFVTNFVAWSLLKVNLLDKLPAPVAKTRTTKR